jgi:hypothetical protein
LLATVAGDHFPLRIGGDYYDFIVREAAGGDRPGRCIRGREQRPIVDASHAAIQTSSHESLAGTICAVNRYLDNIPSNRRLLAPN